jgi:hypothetical protein
MPAFLFGSAVNYGLDASKSSDASVVLVLIRLCGFIRTLYILYVCTKETYCKLESVMNDRQNNYTDYNACTLHSTAAKV